MFGIGHWELVIIGLVALLIFGSRLPGVARGLGKSITAFRDGLRDVDAEGERSPVEKRPCAKS